jgi:hypothetical protein
MHDMADVRIQMDEAQGKPPIREHAADRKISPRFAAIVVLASLVSLVFGALAARLWLQERTPELKDQVSRSYMDLAPASQLGGGWPLEHRAGWDRPSRTAFALTPDGKNLVFYGLNEAGKTQLFLHPLDGWVSIPIPGTEGAFYCWISADGRDIGFWADGKIKRVPIGGGAPTTICEETRTFWGASWSSGNQIVYACAGNLYKVRAGGGKQELFLAPDPQKGERAFRLPHFVPAGEILLFSTVTSIDRYDNPRIEALTLKSG